MEWEQNEADVQFEERGHVPNGIESTRNASTPVRSHWKSFLDALEEQEQSVRHA